MTLFGRTLAVSIPDTVLEEKGSPRDKTAKLGLIARACAIYGVDLIEVFAEPQRRGESAEICKILEYLETPQYLRRRLYPLDETLRYAGVLPPLRIPSHKPKVPFDSIRVGEVREGVANDDGTVDVGLDIAPKLEGKAQGGKRLTVRFTSTRPARVELVGRMEAPGYWGYTVERRTMAQVLDDARFRVRVVTSRLGVAPSQTMGRLEDEIRATDSIKLIFGSPSKGLFEMAGKELSKRVDFVLNLFPQQQVETVRTEEAIFTGLGLVSLITAKKA